MESCNHWIHPNTICLQLLSMYKWAHWWMMEEVVVLCVCLLFSHVLCLRPLLWCLHAAANIGLQALFGMYKVCGSWLGFNFCSSFAFFFSLWNHLIMCFFVKPASYSSPGYVSCSETIAPLLKWVNWMMSEKLRVDSTVKFSIVKLSISTMLGK